MTIEKLMVKRENGKRKTFPTGETFTSFTEVYNHCLEHGSKLEPRPDVIALKFRISDSNEVFDIAIAWNKDNEAYLIEECFPRLSK